MNARGVVIVGGEWGVNGGGGRDWVNSETERAQML